MKGLKLRNGVWYIHTQINGKRIRKSLGLPKACKKEAEIVAKEFWLEVARGNIGIAKKNPSLETLFENYLAYKKHSVSPGWIDILSMYFDRVRTDLHVEFIQDIEPVKFQDWLIDMDSQNTARKIQDNVNAVFDYAVQREEIEENPIKNLPKIKHQYKTKEPLTRTEFIEFAKRAKDYTAGNILHFLMKTGCRVTEAIEAVWQRVDIQERIFILRSADTKTGRGRNIPLTKDLVVMLRQIRPENPKPKDHVFLTNTGKPFDRHNIRRVVKEIGESIGRDDITTHTLRHTFTTLCNDNMGVVLADVSKALGHTTEKTTRIYDHPGMARMRKVAEQLPSVLFA